jgi:hypothetical protein
MNRRKVMRIASLALADLIGVAFLPDAQWLSMTWWRKNIVGTDRPNCLRDANEAMYKWMGNT